MIKTRMVSKQSKDIRDDDLLYMKVFVVRAGISIQIFFPARFLDFDRNVKKWIPRPQYAERFLRLTNKLAEAF